MVARLIARGHEVTVLGPTTIEARMRTVGCDFVADTSMSHYDSRTDYPPDEVRWARDSVWLGSATGQAHAVVGQAAATGTDVVVCEGPLFAAMAAAEATASRREQLSASALEIARAASVPAALADAISARHVALWSAPPLSVPGGSAGRKSGR